MGVRQLCLRRIGVRGQKSLKTAALVVRLRCLSCSQSQTIVAISSAYTDNSPPFATLSPAHHIETPQEGVKPPCASSAVYHNVLWQRTVEFMAIRHGPLCGEVSLNIQLVVRCVVLCSSFRPSFPSSSRSGTLTPAPARSASCLSSSLVSSQRFFYENYAPFAFMTLRIHESFNLLFV